MRAQQFLYPPGVAYFYAPFAHFPPIASFIANLVLMLGFSFVAASLVSRIYRFPFWFAVATTFAWAPLLNSIIVGQSTAVALMLFLIVIYTLTQNRQFLAGIATGALMFKPTNAIVILVILAIRRRWRSLAVALSVGALWYALGVAAAAGDWLWPVQYLHALENAYAYDFAANQMKSFSFPTLLMYLGVAQPLAIGLAMLLLAFCVWLLTGATILEAASIAPLITLAVSPHVWPYDAGLLVPTISYYMCVAGEPWRTRLVAAAYLLGAVPLIGFDALFVVVLGGLELWTAHALKMKGRILWWRQGDSNS